MNIPLAFARVFFVILSTFFMTLYMLSTPNGSTLSNLVIGLGTGFGFSLVCIACDSFFKRFNLRAFNITLLGLFIGCLMGQALLLIFSHVLNYCVQVTALTPQNIAILKIALFLFGCYLGTILTLRSSDEIALSIPFIKFSPVAEKRKGLLVDPTALADTRVIDVAATGILDHQLVVPRFLIKELYSQTELGEESAKAKARKALDTIKKLEALPSLHLRYNETDFPEIKENTNKLLRLARVLDCNILTADLSRIQTPILEGVRLINLHALSNALKPLMQTAEQLKIKIQRVGKEPRQGIGYLEDGTMVVVNGGGEFIGEVIEAQVLSVKHTTAGRMIFCNAHEEDSLEYQAEYHER